MRYFIIILLISLIAYTSEGNLSDILKSIRAHSRNSHNLEREIINTANGDGYDIEEHYVTTADKYILKMHRIPPYGKSQNGLHADPLTKTNAANAPAVLMMHGLLGVSDTWLIAGVGRSLAYILADAGYDVWMGNYRGTTHSRRHLQLNPDNDEFWRFSWNELGLYDLPAFIDYILALKKQSQLHYIGHSQGTTSFFVLTSCKPEYNAKIRTMHALSPVAFMTNTMSLPFIIAGKHPSAVIALAKSIGAVEFFPNTGLFSSLGSKYCKNPNTVTNICANLLFIAGGYNPRAFNISLLPRILSVVPGGASIYQYVHYGQGVGNNNFRKYNFGRAGNIKRYGKKTPPSYRLELITVPIYMYYGANDLISNPKDVETLRTKLRNVAAFVKLPDPRWSHFDFLWSNQIKEYLNDRILKEIQVFDRNNHFT